MIELQDETTTAEVRPLSRMAGVTRHRVKPMHTHEWASHMAGATRKLWLVENFHFQCISSLIINASQIPRPSSNREGRHKFLTNVVCSCDVDPLCVAGVTCK